MLFSTINQPKNFMAITMTGRWRNRITIPS